MRQDELVLLAVKLVFGGLAAFLAIFLWSKLYDGAWMALVGGAVTCYAGLVYDMLRAIGVVDSAPLAMLALTVLPFFFYILAFILMIVRTMKN
jgi:uncharacterized membrane protein (DUF2068 family)